MEARLALSQRELVAFGAGGLFALGCLSHGPVHARMVPSASMAPTLQPGDRLLMVQTHPGGMPERSSLVVFRPPFRGLPGEGDAPWPGVWGEALYVKRVIGLPGDRVRVLPDRGIELGGKPFAEPYVERPARYGWGPVTVPAGHVLVLGDNRNDSFDGHHWGMLPIVNIVGRPAAVFWPPLRVQRF